MNQSPIAHTGLLEKLSYDINSTIFSYLDQQDCLNCMATCREWYDLIPQFTQANWKTLRVNSDGISQSQERNLGKHVNYVSFDYVRGDFLLKMMQKLLDYECTEIESFEFDYCISGTTEKEQNVFLSLLRRLASHRLTHLKIEDCRWNFTILDLLFVCPHLTHFSFEGGHIFNSDHDDHIPIQLLPSDQLLYNTLVYLHVGVFSPFIQDQSQSVVSRSPNLKYFIGADGFLCDKGSEILVPPELILSSCPKLEYYVGDGSYDYRVNVVRDVLARSSTLSLSTVTATNSNKNSSSNSSGNNDQKISPFHYFSVSSNDDASRIVFVLRKYKDTLKHVRFVGTTLESRNGACGWLHTFQTIPLQQLRTLYCDDSNYTIESIITLLNTCCGTIQEVRLQHLSSDHHILDVPTLERLQTLPQLRILTIKGVTFVDESSMLILLERLPSLENLTFLRDNPFTLPEQAAPLLKNLRHLTLVEIYSRSPGQPPFVRPLLVSPDLFVSLSQRGSKLESVTLKGAEDVGIPFIVLDALATLPSLKFLDVNGVGRYFNEKLNEEKEEQHVVEFLNKCLLGFDSNINSNITTVASSTKIKDLTLHHVSKLTSTMLNILGEFPNLENLCISLDPGIYLNNNQSLAGSVKTCLNLDLYGVLDLLRKSKKLKRIVFEGLISYGKRGPSDYLKKKLVKQQQTNFQLRKFIVKPGLRVFSKKHGVKFERKLEIINIHYQ